MDLARVAVDDDCVAMLDDFRDIGDIADGGNAEGDVTASGPAGGRLPSARAAMSSRSGDASTASRQAP